MTPRKAILDTNIYVGWLNQGRFADLMVGRGLLRLLSSVVRMELAVGATTQRSRRALAQLVRGYDAGDRLANPSPEVFERSGWTLARLKARGLDIRRASLVHDVLIAQTARSIGATVYTADRDFEQIRSTDDFALMVV